MSNGIRFHHFIWYLYTRLSADYRISSLVDGRLNDVFGKCARATRMLALCANSDELKEGSYE